jgi:hypothetical protein
VGRTVWSKGEEGGGGRSGGHRCSSERGGVEVSERVSHLTFAQRQNSIATLVPRYIKSCCQFQI